MKPQHVVISCMLVAAILVGCVTQKSERWKLYDAGPFTFSMPSNTAKDTSRHGIDTYVRVFTNADMFLIFDYEADAGKPLHDVTNKPKYISHSESIAGYKVQIASFDGYIHSPEHFNYNIIASFLGAGLTMQVACATKSDYDKALRIFRSVKFTNGSVPW